ncbi:protoporphyrinogen/coproporphyrinogen oxidase [Kitasatospora sp. NPDC001574]
MTEHQAPAPNPSEREERRARVAARLARLGPGPAAVFADACRLLDHDLQLSSRTMLLFHMLRELESSVREVLVPDEARKAGKSAAETQKLEVKSILAAYGIAEDEPAGSTWLRIVGKLHGWAHRNNLEAPRTVDPDTLQLFDDIEDMLDRVLDALDARYLTILERLDALAALTAPTKANAASLLKEFPQNHLTWNTFFTQLVNPAWIAPLNAQEFFSRPPTGHGAEGQDTRWPATAYLARVASQAPSEIMVIARDRIPDTDNPFVNLDIVEIALALPPASAGSGFLVPPVDGRRIKASTFSSNKWGWLERSAPDAFVLRTSLGRLREEEPLELPDEELVAGSLADLGEAIGLTARPYDTAVTRWRAGLPQYPVGHLDRVARIRAAADRVGALALCGAAYDGVGIPACIASARTAVAGLDGVLTPLTGENVTERTMGA